MNRSFLELIKSRLHSWSCVTVQGLAKRPYNDTYTCFQSKVHSQPASTATWWRKIYLHDYRDVYTYTSARIHVLDKRNTSCHLSDYSEITVARRGIVVVYISEERWKESHVVREKRLQGDAGSSNIEKLAPTFPSLPLLSRSWGWKFFAVERMDRFARLGRGKKNQIRNSLKWKENNGRE